MLRSDDPQLLRGRAAEQAAARWIQIKWDALILPVYDYCGLEGGKAPKLQGASESLVTPDLLVVRRGFSWCEVKLKETATFFRIKGRWETGIETRLWRQYQLVAERTGVRVWIMFLHEEQDEALIQDIAVLATDQRDSFIFQRGRKIPMTYFPCRIMRPIASCAEVLGRQPGRAA